MVREYLVANYFYQHKFIIQQKILTNNSI